MSDKDKTCERCRNSDDTGRVCRRYPPVPLLTHPGKMELLRAVMNHKTLVVVESAFPATDPGSTCGEWAPDTDTSWKAQQDALAQVVETQKALRGTSF